MKICICKNLFFEQNFGKLKFLPLDSFSLYVLTCSLFPDLFQAFQRYIEDTGNGPGDEATQ